MAIEHSSIWILSAARHRGPRQTIRRRAFKVWDEGWKHNRRPNLQAMVEYLNKELLQDAFPTMKGFTRDLNSATHGDPFSAQWNVVAGAGGVPVFPVSKNLCSPQLADEVCAEVIPWLAATMGIMSAVFGQEGTPKPN